MITKTRIGAKYLLFGLAIGLLFAQKSGQDTRNLIFNRLRELASEILDIDLTGSGEPSNPPDRR